jgi:hypothetical protein
MMAVDLTGRSRASCSTFSNGAFHGIASAQHPQPAYLWPYPGGSRLIVLCFFIEGRLHGSDFARWWALTIFFIASVTDFFDGYLARAWDQTSNIGRMLDPIADKLLVSAILLLIAADGTIAGWSIWAAIIILCREILVSGLREYLAALKVSVPVTWIAKWKTTLADGGARLPARRPRRRQGAALHDPDRHRPCCGLRQSSRFIPATTISAPGCAMWWTNELMRIVYFAWVRERLGKGSEELDLPENVKTVGDLIAIWRRSAKSMKPCSRFRR